MTYMIDARLERGAPLLTLFDAATGEERLHWRGDNAAGGERGWQALFKRLVLLSCADRMRLVQRAKSPRFGEECLECTDCGDHGAAPAGQEGLGHASSNSGHIISLREWCDRQNRMERGGE